MSEEERKLTPPEPAEDAGQNVAPPEAADAGPSAEFTEEQPSPEGIREGAAGGAAESAASVAEQESRSLELGSRPPGRASADDASEISGDDTLLAALTWLSMVVFQLPILSVVLLLIEPNRSRPFQRYHAVAAIAFWFAALIYEGVAGLAMGMLTLVTLGIFAICMVCLWVIFFVPHIVALIYAFQALTGKTPEIPVITKLAHDQHWI